MQEDQYIIRTLTGTVLQFPSKMVWDTKSIADVKPTAALRKGTAVAL